jgi:hypothetical protein
MIAPPSGFLIVEHHGIWRVMLDGRFFGDFRSREQALDCMSEAQGLTAEARASRGGRWRIC